MRFPFESEEAQLLNKQIFETIYYGALESSCESAEKFGPYETYEGSPVSKGILQYDMWNVTPTDLHDWAALKARVAKHGVRNSLLLAPMPTASTAQILGNNEGIEAYTSNIYSRRVLSGEFQVVNQHLLRDLTELDLWDDEMKNKLIAANGSIQVCTYYSCTFHYKLWLAWFTFWKGGSISIWMAVFKPKILPCNIIFLDEIIPNCFS